jgi:hypothetical protein
VQFQAVNCWTCLICDNVAEVRDFARSFVTHACYVILWMSKSLCLQVKIDEQFSLIMLRFMEFEKRLVLVFFYE